MRSTTLYCYYAFVIPQVLAWLLLQRYLVTRIERIKPGFWDDHGICVRPGTQSLAGTPWGLFLFVIRRDYTAVKDRRVLAAGDSLLTLVILFMLALVWASGFIPL